MFKNIHYKLLAFLLAIIFWIFIVSLENVFTIFPQAVPVQIFNLGEKLAAVPVGITQPSVKITLRTEDKDILKRLSSADFEAYVDVKNLGVGVKKVPISVSSKNPKVSIVKFEPRELEITIEPVEEKIVRLVVIVEGEPKEGFEVKSVKAAKETVKMTGSKSALKTYIEARAIVKLEGTEDKKIAKKALIKPYDIAAADDPNIKFEPQEINVEIDITATTAQKTVGIQPKLTGRLSLGFVKEIRVSPSVVTISGPPEKLKDVTSLSTEEIDLKFFEKASSVQAKLILPEGISLAKGESDSVKVEVVVEKTVQ